MRGVQLGLGHFQPRWNALQAEMEALQGARTWARPRRIPVQPKRRGLQTRLEVMQQRLRQIQPRRRAGQLRVEPERPGRRRNNFVLVAVQFFLLAFRSTKKTQDSSPEGPPAPTAFQSPERSYFSVPDLGAQQ